MAPQSAVTFGKRLRQLRHQAGMSIAELARAAELTESAVYRLEAEDRASPRAKTIMALAKALHVTADELLGIQEASERQNVVASQVANLPLLRNEKGLRSEGRAVMSVCENILPTDVPIDRLAVMVVPDNVLADLPKDSLAIIALDHPWEDSDLLVVSDEQGNLTIRRGYREGEKILAVGSDLSVRHLLPTSAIKGRVMKIVRTLS